MCYQAARSFANLVETVIPAQSYFDRHSPAILNPAQAARIIESLNISTTTTAPVWPITNPSADTIFETGFLVPPLPPWVGIPTLATWPQYQAGDDFAEFWQPLAANHAGAFLDLVLWALAQGFTISPLNTLADAIKNNLLATGPLTNVGQLTTPTATPATWQTFFTNLAAANAPNNILPPFTLPGTFATRVATFIQWVETFFQLGTAVPVLNAVAAELPLRYGVPTSTLSGGRSRPIRASSSASR